jgi:DNA-binding XRE family transcriptional regulator
MSQEHVAYNAGVSRHTYYRLEKGIARKDAPANPSLQTVIAIAVVLGVDMMEVLPSWTPELRP